MLVKTDGIANKMTRRYLIIGVVIIVILGLVAIWWFFLRGTTTPPAPAGSTGILPQTGGAQTGTGTSGNLPSGGNPVAGIPNAATKFGVVSDEPVLAYFVDAGNNVIIVEPDGKIARVTNGQTTFLSSSQIANLMAASFSYDGAKALVSFGDRDNPQTSIFDLATKAWAPLTMGIISPVWSPSDYRIAYLASNTDGTKTLATLNAAKTTAKPSTLLSLNAQDLSLVWPSKNNIVLSEKPSALTNGSALLFNLQNQTLTPITLEVSGFEALWNGNATSAAATPFGLVFSANTPRPGGRLRLINPSGNTVQSVNFLTLPSKCLFHRESPVLPPGASSTTSTVPVAPYLALYCAVPEDQDELSSARLPDDYEQMALFTADAFYGIHTDTGAMDSVFSPPQNMDAADLGIFNHILFFINRYDQKLYAISLTQ
jgi:hypothetical protein